MKTHEFTIKEQELITFKKRRLARSMVANALSKGELNRPNECELCKEKCIPHSHHVDYGKPLKVKWVCRKCHGLVHRKDHPLNPDNCYQSPMPQIFQESNNVVISFMVPVENFIALKREAESKGKSISEIMRKEILEKYPIQNKQLEFVFMEKINDDTQSLIQQRIQSLAENESLLHQPKSPILPKIRRKRDLNLSRMDGELPTIFERHGNNSRKLQRNFAN